jgi:hypothetical protein
MVPAKGARLKDGVVREVFGHLTLIPPLANHQEAMWGSVVEEEYNILLSLFNGGAKARVTFRSRGVGRRGLEVVSPVLLAALIHSIGPIFKLGKASDISVCTPSYIRIQRAAKIKEDVIHIPFDAELLAALD